MITIFVYNGMLSCFVKFVTKLLITNCVYLVFILTVEYDNDVSHRLRIAQLPFIYRLTLKRIPKASS